MASPDDLTWGKRLLQNWDLVVAVVLALGYFTVSVWTGKALVDLGPILLAGIAGGFTIGGAAFVAARNIGDLLGKDEYGQLVRKHDFNESRARRPYEIVASVAFVTSFWSLVLYIIYRPLSDFVLYFVTSPLVGLASYTILGSITLIGIQRRHLARAARLRSMRDDNELRRRTSEHDGE